MSNIEDLKTAVISGNRKDAKALTTALLEEGVAPEVLLEEALIPVAKQWNRDHGHRPLLNK